jgi:ubiquinone/menaquinone biosynthesis C-methylase UbiE
MLEWTGERFLPWLKEPALAYEHLHRYAYAAQLVRGKRVIDLASGEGYGSNMLAQSASAVIGIDIDPGAVEHARAKYGNRGRNVQFLIGSITDIPIIENHSYDVAVCFEGIEHIQDQESLLGEVKRLLKPDGLLIVSTPSKTAYQDHSTDENPFHLKELTFEEFRELLARHFKHSAFLGQRIYAQSSIWPLESHDSSSIQEFLIKRAGEEYALSSKLDDKRVPLYIIALASDSSSAISEQGSVLVDETNQLLQDNSLLLRDLMEGKVWQQTALEWLKKKSEEDGMTISSLEKAVAWKDSQLSERTAAIDWMKSQVADFEKRVASNEEAIGWYAKMAASNQQTIHSQEEALAWRASQVIALQSALEHKVEELKSIQTSRIWQLSLQIRRLSNKLRVLLRFREQP